ncbi:hypothetical protein NNJEOMEG_00998 [Fundidesulfovibrio magnetotacticus]|uniref:Peptidase C51 domain-containing protein n=1 Tax=Fundidesulfovibrio magnetotacticus TaxID=2730080 RepID=A0A6V8LU45_9BACT|nr:hypothetical protein [Fundidesulfovibrio magnetotacticus]GFK93167.1 hypothetical protein NNJEOMEG_00998 [Fundidesulfovibrio magnetotacticus]
MTRSPLARGLRLAALCLFTAALVPLAAHPSSGSAAWAAGQPDAKAAKSARQEPSDKAAKPRKKPAPSKTEGRTKAPAAEMPEKELIDAPQAKTPAPAVDPALEKGGAQHCYRLRPQTIRGRCEPQSLPYARCRTGDMSCRGNAELSPIGWYRCADLHGQTRQIPSAGAVFILDDNIRHRMATGHVFVVEKFRELGHGRFELTLSHTNHDRRCSIETNVLAEYDQHAKNLSMSTGAWSRWGKRLKTLGFIVK